MIFTAKIRSGEETHHIAIEATSYTEAETRAHQAANVIAKEMYDVESIVKSTYNELVLAEKGEHEKWLKGKVAYMAESNSGKLTTKKVILLVRAQDYDSAYKAVKDHAEDFLDDARVFGLEETDISDYFDQEVLLEFEVEKLAKNLLKDNIKMSVEVF